MKRTWLDGAISCGGMGTWMKHYQKNAIQQPKLATEKFWSLLETEVATTQLMLQFATEFATEIDHHVQLVLATKLATEMKGR